MKGGINLDTNSPLIEVEQNTSDIYIFRCKPGSRGENSFHTDFRAKTVVIIHQVIGGLGYQYRNAVLSIRSIVLTGSDCMKLGKIQIHSWGM